MQLSVIISVLLPLLALFNTGDATITAWSEPAINTADGAGALSFAESVATGTAGLATMVVATPGDNKTIDSYTLLTTGTPFSVVAATGVLNLDSALDFETTPSYVIEIRAVDDTTPTAISATATITITVTDANDIPTFGAPAYSECIADAAASGTTLATILATDADATDTTLTHTIINADADASATDFDVTDAGVITSTAVMASATTSKYELILKAADSTTTATTTIIVEVGCSSATTVAIGITTLLVALVTALQ